MRVGPQRIGPQRIGIVALLHESNTFVRQLTGLDHFQRDLYLFGDAVRDSLRQSHHEVGGFFSSFGSQSGVTLVPLVAFRATPSGVIEAEAFEALWRGVQTQLAHAGPLDGLLVASHGAAVSERYRDADGEWLTRLRTAVGDNVPIVATLDAHANLSRDIVAATDALVAYRTNPHLDQHERGCEAAGLLRRILLGEIQPTMAAAFPPLIINIDRQCTDDLHLREIYRYADAQRAQERVVSNSVLLGFPYADVAELGAATVVVTDDDLALAQSLADELAQQLISQREAFRGQLVDVESSLELCVAEQGTTCLLDMGDNVGGGSAGDGTTLLEALARRQIGPSFVCLFDPAAVTDCERAGIGRSVSLTVGGKTDDQHGAPFPITADVISMHDGRFTETSPRHGGIVDFNQGRTAVIRTRDKRLTIMLTSLRVAPFSLRQLTDFRIEPSEFRVLVAKGVNAPFAAYRSACQQFVRVNTIGSTTADLSKLTFRHRRRDLFPFVSSS